MAASARHPGCEPHMCKHHASTRTCTHVQKQKLQVSLIHEGNASDIVQDPKVDKVDCPALNCEVKQTTLHDLKEV